MKGRIADAMAIAETATDAAVLTGNDQVAVWALWADAMVCSLAGETARALASAREAVARSEHLTETFFSSLSRLHLASALNAAGDPVGARAELAAVETGPGQRLLDLRGGTGWELLIRTLLSLGELEPRPRRRRRPIAGQEHVLPQRAAIAMCAGPAVLLARGDPTGAIDTAREALPLAESAGNPLLGARARALIGTALGRAGSTDLAVAELEQAERTLYEAGALRDADAAAQELRRLGRRGPRRRVRGGGGAIGALSPREREVATLVAAGKRNRDVAAALFAEREDRREPSRPASTTSSGCARGRRWPRSSPASSPNPTGRRRRCVSEAGLVGIAQRTGDVLAPAVHAAGDRRLRGCGSDRAASR